MRGPPLPHLPAPSHLRRPKRPPPLPLPSGQLLRGGLEPERRRHARRVQARAECAEDDRSSTRGGGVEGDEVEDIDGGDGGDDIGVSWSGETG